MYKGYAICPTEWIEDKNLRKKNLLPLLLKISALTARDGWCFASNDYLSEKIGVTKVTISRNIKKLKELNYIRIEYKYRGAEVTRRFIRLSQMITDDYHRCYSTVNTDDKDNSINSNSISTNTKKNIKKKPITENASDRKRAQSKKKKSPPKKKKAPPTREECIEYFRDKWAKKHEKVPEACAAVAKRAWEYYTRADWRDRNNSRVKSWKLKIAQVWMKDSNLNEFKPKKKIKISTGKVVYHS